MRQKTIPFIPDIERLRGVAVLLVVLHHFFIEFDGWVGVNIFFVISGFVVTCSLQNLLGNPISSRLRGMVLFYEKRFWRILPPAVAVLGIYLLTAHFMPWHFDLPKMQSLLPEVFYVLTFQYNYRFAAYEVVGYLGQFWSLSVEEHFYFVLPFLFFLVRSPKRRLICILIALLGVWIAVHPALEVAGRTAYYTTHAQMGFLLLGVLLALLREKLPEIKGHSQLKSALALTSLVAILILPKIFRSYSMENLVVVVRFPLMGLFSTLLVYLALSGSCFSSCPKVVRALLSWVGRRSYSLYLIHPLIIMLYHDVSYGLGFKPAFFHRLLFSSYGQWSISAALCLGLAHLLYEGVERPFQKLGRLHPNRRDRKAGYNTAAETLG